MCLIIFAYRTHPDYLLVLAANRDEFYDRPALGARFWEDCPGLLAGKDLKGGGTWMGVHESGRYAALTNYRAIETRLPDAPSRGLLVRQYLEQGKSAESFPRMLKNSEDYNGFNFLAGDRDSLYHFSNQSNRLTRIQPGIHGISNALMDTPWSKVHHSKKQMNSLIETDSVTEESLFGMLLNRETYPGDSLPETGLPPELEKAVSPVFIQTPDYGTRCSTLLFISHDGEVRFTERVYRPGTGIVAEENRYSFEFDSL